VGTLMRVLAKCRGVVVMSLVNARAFAFRLCSTRLCSLKTKSVERGNRSKIVKMVFL
jgi:hypothetical protein